MRVVVFATVDQKIRGLQHRRFIEEDILFVFPEVGPGDRFHSENVPEPFDICFLDASGRVISVSQMRPPDDLVDAPVGTAAAMEARAGNLARWGIVSGSVVSLSP